MRKQFVCMSLCQLVSFSWSFPFHIDLFLIPSITSLIFVLFIFVSAINITIFYLNNRVTTKYPFLLISLLYLWIYLNFLLLPYQLRQTVLSSLFLFSLLSIWLISLLISTTPVLADILEMTAIDLRSCILFFWGGLLLEWLGLHWKLSLWWMPSTGQQTCSDFCQPWAHTGMEQLVPNLNRLKNVMKI